MLSHAELKQIPLFARLAVKELDYLAGVLPDIHLAPGEYIAHEGEGRALIICVEGKLELTKKLDGVDRFVAHRVPGTLFGEVPIALNGVFMASLRAIEPSRVIWMEPKVFHTLSAAAPEVAATVGVAAMERIGGLQGLAREAKRAELLVIGPRTLPSIQALRTFLHRNQVEFEWRAPDADDDKTRYPKVQLPDGTQLDAPSIPSIASAVGLSIAPKHAAYDVVIVGGGPAGMAAAVYAASEGLHALLVEREAPGGQAGTSSRIENYLGFPHGVSGDELASRALQQARRLGAEIVVTRTVESIDTASRTLVLDGGTAIHARAIILALGVAWRRLAIDSLDRWTGLGVYYGASRSEAPSTQGRDIFLIGAGNSAGQAALFFANHARSVTLVVRGAALDKSMSHYLVRQLGQKPNIRIALHSEITAVHGGDQLESVDVVDRRTDVHQRYPAGGLFVFIGADAASDWLPPAIARDERGYIVTGAGVARSGRLLETSVPGIFAAGDIRAGSVKRVAASVGDGSLAITFVRQYLEEAREG